jgi:hypothetical protein
LGFQHAPVGVFLPRGPEQPNEQATAGWFGSDFTLFEYFSMRKAVEKVNVAILKFGLFTGRETLTDLLQSLSS